MRKIIFLCLLCFSSFAQVKRQDEKGNPTFYADTLNGMFNGKFVSYNKNKSIAIQGNFKENQKNGVWIYNDSLGNLKHKRSYENNYEFENLLNKNDTTPKFILKKDKNDNIIFPDVNDYDSRQLAIEEYIYLPKIKTNNFIFANDLLWNEIKEYIDTNAFDSLQVYKNPYHNNYEKLDSLIIKEKIEKYKFDIIGYKLKRYSYYNATCKIYEYNRVTAICPVVWLKDYNFSVDLFWIYFPNLKSKTSIKFKSNENIKLLYDFLIFNNYSSYNYWVSQNQNRWWDDTYEYTVDILNDKTKYEANYFDVEFKKLRYEYFGVNFDFEEAKRKEKIEREEFNRKYNIKK